MDSRIDLKVTPARRQELYEDICDALEVPYQRRIARDVHRIIEQVILELGDSDPSQLLHSASVNWFLYREFGWLSILAVAPKACLRRSKTCGGKIVN